MPLLRHIASGLRSLFRKERADRELDEELRGFMEMAAEESTKQGRSQKDAFRAVRLERGSLEAAKEAVRSAGWESLLETFWQDSCYGLRMLRKSPGFTAVAVLTLALGIGANTAIFCVARAVFWRALPYRDSESLIFLTEQTNSISDLSISYPDFVDWQRQARAFDGMSAYQETNFDFDENGQQERISGRNVSANFFELLRVTPVLGRTFVPADDDPGAASVVLSSYRFWQTHLGANPDIIGTTIRLNGQPFTIIGVLPRDFSFETSADVYAPIGRLSNSFLMRNRAKHPFIYAIARLKSGTTLAEARTELSAISRRLRKEYPATNDGLSAVATPLQEQLARDARSTFRALAAVVAFLLLISIVNVANLLLTRASWRESEFAVRASLGATRSRIVRQVLTESVLLGLCGAAVGMILASASLDSLGVLVPVGLRDMVTLRINAAAVVFTVITCLVAAIAFGLCGIPFASRAHLNDSLRNSVPAGGMESVRRRLRGSLVVSEIALAFVILASAGLVLRSFRLASRVNPGFDLDNVLTMRIQLSQSRHSGDDQITAFLQQAQNKLQRVPGVAGAAAVFPLPFTSHGYPFGFYIQGGTIPPPGQLPTSNFHFVTPGYFDAMGIPLLRGRDFSPKDNEKSPAVAVISENFAARYWPVSDAIGKQVHLDPAEGGNLVTVIGIVGNTKESGLDSDTTTEIYLPYLQRPIPFMTFVIRTRLAPLSVYSAAVAAIQSIDNTDPVYDVRTMRGFAADGIADRRIDSFLFGVVGLLIIALSAVGVYAVISCGVAQRTHEIGVRIALGAPPRAILRLVFRTGAILAILGIGIGTGAALAFAPNISGLLFGIGARDPLTFVCIGGLLAVVALAACYIPARRAMRVDPMIALRYE